jgi:hypothetical protein
MGGTFPPILTTNDLLQLFETLRICEATAAGRTNVTVRSGFVVVLVVVPVSIPMGVPVPLSRGIHLYIFADVLLR